MPTKARDAFRTISEVANWLDVPAHVLRFWESKFAQIKPVKRAGGRRYYRPADMKLIGGIKVLLHDDGLTIRGVQKMLKEDGIKKISALSPPLDMPSEEEGAARRQARRARRQARKATRADAAPKALTEAQSETQVEANTDAEAPYTHVDDAEAEVAGARDNVVSLHGGAEPQPASDPEPEPEPEPDLAPEPEAEAVPDLVADTPAPEMAEPAEPLSEIPSQTASDTDGEPAPASTPTPQPAPPIPNDPEPGSVTLSQAQTDQLQRRASLRKLGLTTDFAEGTEDKLADAYARLTNLRDRMGRDGSDP